MNKSELEQHKSTHWDVLKAAIQIQVTEHSPYSDHKLLQLYQEGVQQRDYDKQYQLIVALELGCGAPYAALRTKKSFLIVSRLLFRKMPRDYLP